MGKSRDQLVLEHGRDNIEGLGRLLASIQARYPGIKHEDFYSLADEFLGVALESGLARNEGEVFHRLGTWSAVNLPVEIAPQAERQNPEIVAKSEPAQLSPEKQARLTEFNDANSETFKRWQAGDTGLNAERTSLYDEQFAGQQIDISKD